MERIKGILAAGALTALVLLTAVGLSSRNFLLQNSNGTTVQNQPIIERAESPVIQPRAQREGQPIPRFEENDDDEFERAFGEQWEGEDD